MRCLRRSARRPRPLRPALASLDRVPHNLPVQPSPLIGREDELSAVLAALESFRLVTLTGFGGMGKTRLSLQVAAELASGDGDGVWFVDLAGATDPASVPGLIGRATGLGGSTADEVVAALSGQRLLPMARRRVRSATVRR